ncbi:unnamed protein product [Withania somnifera]
MEEELNKIENQQVDEDEDEGPPPGFDSLALPPQHTNFDDADEGPPPGWSSISQQNNQQTPDVEMGSKEHELEDDEDGPPPGWDTVIPQKKLSSSPPTIAAVTCDIEMEKKEAVEDEDNGRQLGLQLTPKLPLLETSTPPSGTHGASLKDIEMEKKEVVEDEDNSPPPGWQLTPQLPPLQTSTPPSGTQGVPLAEMEIGSKQEGTKNEELRPQLEKQPFSDSRHMKPIVPQSSSRAAATVSAKMGQMVCGSCRQLLSYPQGAKLVKCSCCQTVNLVLEAHDVGQVKCGGCAVLLMYPYGAPSVRCSSCRYVTKIGAHNRRPPQSMQQPQRRHPSYQVH